MGIVSIGKDPFPADRCIIQSLLKLNLKPNYFFIFFAVGLNPGRFFLSPVRKGGFPAERVIAVCGSDNGSVSMCPGRAAARKLC